MLNGHIVFHSLLTDKFAEENAFLDSVWRQLAEHEGDSAFNRRVNDSHAGFDALLAQLEDEDEPDTVRQPMRWTDD